MPTPKNNRSTRFLRYHPSPLFLKDNLDNEDNYGCRTQLIKTTDYSDFSDSIRALSFKDNFDNEDNFGYRAALCLTLSR